MNISDISLASPVVVSCKGVQLTTNGKSNDKSNDKTFSHSSSQKLLKLNTTTHGHQRKGSSSSQTSPMIVGSNKMMMAHAKLANS